MKKLVEGIKRFGIVSTGVFLAASSFVYADVGTGLGQNLTPSYSNSPNTIQRLIGKYYTQKNYAAAIKEIDKLLVHDPNNIDLLMKKAGIYADLGDYDQSITILDHVLQLDPKNAKAIALKNKIVYLDSLIPRNELGFDWDEVNVTNPHQWWQYASVHYYRFTHSAGTYGARINYANRYNTTGEQYQLEAYPKFNFGSVALSYAYANSTQTLFPTVQYTIEPYFSLPHGFQLSLGARNLKSVGVNIYNTTGSLGRYVGKYFFWLRDYHFTPKASDLIEIGMTRYFDKNNSLLTLRGDVGRSPDIADLAPLNQIIVLKVYSVSLVGQTNVTPSVIGKMGVGYLHEDFPSGRTRSFADVSVGVYWQF